MYAQWDNAVAGVPSSYNDVSTDACDAVLKHAPPSSKRRIHVICHVGLGIIAATLLHVLLTVLTNF